MSNQNISSLDSPGKIQPEQRLANKNPLASEVINAPKSGDITIDSLLHGIKWKNKKITFSFYDDSLGGAYYGSEKGVREVSQEIKDEVRYILKEVIEPLIDVEFVEVSDSKNSYGDIRYMFSDVSSGSAYVKRMKTSNEPTGGDVHLSPKKGFGSGFGSYRFETLIHETMHALGLKHPGNYNTAGEGVPPYLDEKLDNGFNTLLSYNRPYSKAVTPMTYDIKALQYLYGAKQHKGGDSTYTFDTVNSYTIGGKNFGSNFSTLKQTIWDSGGVDTLDFSNLSLEADQAYHFDMREGGILTTGEAYNGTTYRHEVSDKSYTTHAYGTKLAYGVTIENLIGTGGNDLVTGNDAANVIKGKAGDDNIKGLAGDDKLKGGDGHDILRGGDGADILDGGKGRDTFVYKKFDERGDTILDFQVGRDQIDLHALFEGSNFTSSNPFKDYIELVQDGKNTKVKVDVLGDSGDQFKTLVTLDNFAAESLNASDFITASDQAVSSASDPNPSASNTLADNSTDYRIQALFGGSKWTGSKITYSFYDDANGGDYYSFQTNVREVGKTVKSYIRNFLENVIEPLINVDFVEVADTKESSGQLRYMYSEGFSGWSYSHRPMAGPLGGDIHLSPNHKNDWQAGLGSTGYENMINATLYGLGLKRPGESSSGGNQKPFLPGSEDNKTNTIRSYNAAGSRSITPMAYDILTLQSLYGAGKHHSGDTTYLFKSVYEYSVGGQSFGSSNQSIKQSIWDSGGTDTLDFSGLSASTDYRFDLQEGGILTTKTAYNGSTYNENGTHKTHTYGATLAYGMTIENVIGSGGNDQITGNSAANVIQGAHGDDKIEGLSGDDIISGGKGDDQIVGGMGADTLTGGDGRDSFVYKSVKHRKDIITDFEIGIDKIDLSDIFKGSKYHSSHAFRDYIKLEQLGSDTKVRVDILGDNGDKFKTMATLTGVDSNSLNSSHFVV